ncbi:MAG TPA: hypothetical protein VND93_21640 [Myxococcales bacterium]|jgi:hypothetical protein|nr:hypothetical protein [Myxococcales bacterium]
MNKLTIFAAALAAAGVALFPSTRVQAQPAPAVQAAPVSPPPGDAVERHLGALLRARLHDLRQERARAMDLR